MTTATRDVSVAALSPAAFAMTVSGGRWRFAPHLRMIDAAMLDAATMPDQRIIIEMPPRHGKSQLVSRYGAAWYAGSFPDRRVILASYEAGFAATWGAAARNLVTEYGTRVFGVNVRDDSSARDRWDIARHDGGMITAGVGGAITGRGADLLIVDDPVKNAAEANSRTVRDATWEWWTSTAYTRLEPGASAVVLMTRWHEDDLAGRLERGDGDERWRVIRLPAIAETGDVLGREPGEALWPDRYPVDKLMRLRGAIGTYWWSALYQQAPVPPGGRVFDPSNFRVVPAGELPASRRLVRVWDLAATDAAHGGDPDYAVGALWGLSQDGDYVLYDVRRMRADPPAVERAILATAAMDGREVTVYVEREPGAAAKMYADHVRKLVSPHRFRSEPVSGDKVLRAWPAAAASENGQVVVARAGWTDEWLREHQLFPGGQHDDQVDTTSAAVNFLGGFGRRQVVSVQSA